MAGPYTYHGWSASTLTPGFPALRVPMRSMESPITPQPSSTPAAMTIGAHGILQTVFGPNYQKILGLAPGSNVGSQPPVSALASQQLQQDMNNNTPTTGLTPQQLQANMGQPVSGWITPSSVTNMGLRSLTPAANAAQNAVSGLGVPNVNTKLTSATGI